MYAGRRYITYMCVEGFKDFSRGQCRDMTLCNCKWELVCVSADQIELSDLNWYNLEPEINVIRMTKESRFYEVVIHTLYLEWLVFLGIIWTAIQLSSANKEKYPGPWHHGGHWDCSHCFSLGRCEQDPLWILSRIQRIFSWFCSIKWPNGTIWKSTVNLWRSPTTAIYTHFSPSGSINHIFA